MDHRPASASDIPEQGCPAVTPLAARDLAQGRAARQPFGRRLSWQLCALERPGRVDLSGEAAIWTGPFARRWSPVGELGKGRRAS
jgi:hypothetical protein